MLALAVARYLPSVVDGLVLDEVDIGGNVFVGHMPSRPDVAVSVVPSGGSSQPTRNPHNRPRLQLRARGVKDDPIGPFRLAQACMDVLTCLDGVWLDQGGPDEVWVIGVTPIQSEPGPLGADENGRHEYVGNFDVDTHHPTVHRPVIPA